MALSKEEDTLSHQPLGFIVAGVQKGGTTSLSNHMRVCSPHLCFTTINEDHRIDNVEKTKKSFSTPAESDLVEVNKKCERQSPDSRFMVGVEDPKFMYILDEPHAAAVLSVAPNIKIIVLLREPVQRSFSAYSMEVSRNGCQLREAVDFEAAMRAEIARPPPRGNGARACDVAWRGLYDDQLARLHRFFGRARVHVEISDQLVAGGAQLDEGYT